MERRGFSLRPTGHDLVMDTQITDVDDLDDLDPVMVLWRLENEARKRRSSQLPTVAREVG